MDERDGQQRSVAVVGVGRMGVRHIEAAARVGLPVSAICDVSVENLESVSQRFAIPRTRCFTSFDRMLEAVGPEVVAIATTAPSHCALTLSAIESGAKYILCEKPMASSLEECRLMSDAAMRFGVSLAVNHPMRFMEKYRIPRASVESGEFGPLSSIIVAGANFGLAMIVSHLFEMFRFVVGDPVTSVQSWLESELLPNPRGEQFQDRSGKLLASSEGGIGLFVDFSGKAGHGVQTIFIFRDAQVVVDEINGFVRVVARTAAHRGKPTSQYGLASDVVTREIPPSDAVSAAASVWDALLAGEGYPDASVGSAAIAAVVAAHLSHEAGGTRVRVEDAFRSDTRRFDWA